MTSGKKTSTNGNKVSTNGKNETKPIVEKEASSSSSSSNNLSGKAIFYLCLLAVQFGIQPILTRKYTASGICRSTVILVQEMTKFILALTMLYISSSNSSNGNEFQNILSSFSVSRFITLAVFPAGLYSVQNLAALIAYQNLDGLTFNVLNQTKTLSAALCCYLVMGKQQSKVQIIALFILLSSALVMEKIISVDTLGNLLASLTASGSTTEKTEEEAEEPSLLSSWDQKRLTHGVAPILLASFISGLAGALVQKTLQQSSSKSSGGGGSSTGANPYLVSMELCAASTILLGISLLFTKDGKQILADGFFAGWDIYTFIPIFTNSVGGIIVGLVTKYAGSVRKGFALIFGILLSGILQQLLTAQTNEASSDQEPLPPITKEQVIGGVLAAISLYLHATNPPKPTTTKSKTKQE